VRAAKVGDAERLEQLKRSRLNSDRIAARNSRRLNASASAAVTDFGAWTANGRAWTWRYCKIRTIRMTRTIRMIHCRHRA
jgi:hypothetical protein